MTFENYEINSEELILDYRPKIPSKSINTNRDAIYTDILEETFSLPLQKIERFSPSSVVKGLAELKDLIDASAKNLFKKLNQSETDKRNLSLKYKDIEADTDIEIYEKLADTLKEVSKVLSLYKEINFKDREDYESIYKTDMEKIKSLEKAGNTESINYFSIYTDIKINKLMQFYIESMTRYIEDLNFAAEDHMEDKVSVPENIMKAMFDSSLETSEHDRLKLSEEVSKEYIIKNLKKVYAKKKEADTLLLEESKVSTDNDFIKETFLKFTKKSLDELDKAVLDLNKSISLDVLYKSDYYDSIQNKKLLRESYKGIK
jgi:hypothetical protein